MAKNQLEFIRQFLNNEKRVRLSGAEKDLLCKVLENPLRYNGFKSDIHLRSEEGRDPYKGRWHSTSEWQYRINIDSTISIDERYRHICDDGYINDDHWTWRNAWHITDTREIVKILQEIEPEL